MRRMLHLWLSVAGIALCGRCWAASTNESDRTTYDAFAIIHERNIFDPNRSAHRQPSPDDHPEPVAAAPVETFALVGTMSYAKGTFAFFSGSTPDYQKVLRREDEIAGFRIADIAADAVTLATSNDTVVVRVGSGLQHDRTAGWMPASGEIAAPQLEPEGEAVASSPQSADQPAAQPSQPARDSAEGDSEVLKKLMQKREQELQ